MGRDILGPFILEMINIGTYKYMLVLCALKGQHLYNLESFANVWDGSATYTLYRKGICAHGLHEKRMKS